jgi:hypothetical protein
MAVLRRRWSIWRTVVLPNPMYCFLSGATASSPTAYRMSSLPASLTLR